MSSQRKPFSRRTEWDLAPNRFTAAVEKHRNAGRELFDLTESNATHCGLRYDERAILGALANEKSLDYHPAALGLLEARKAVAAYYSERGDLSESVDPASRVDTPVEV